MPTTLKILIIIFILIILSAIIYTSAIYYFVKKKKTHNIYQVTALTGITIGSISMILLPLCQYIPGIKDLSDNNIKILAISVTTYSMLNLIVYLRVHAVADKELHDISIYDFIFKDFNSFNKHLKNKLLKEYKEIKVDKNFIIYQKRKGKLKNIVNCYTENLNKQEFENIIDKINNHYSDFKSRINIHYHGMNTVLIINTHNLSDTTELVTSLYGTFRKNGGSSLRVPILIDLTNKKLYVCDEDRWHLPLQNRIAKDTLYYIYNDYIEEHTKDK